jgi:hypothetical protein
MKFKFLYRRAAREAFAEGTISKEQYTQLTQVLRNPIRKRLDSTEKVDILAEVEQYTNKNGPKAGIDWEAIIQWLKDNWLTILKLILSLIVVLEPPPKER